MNRPKTIDITLENCENYEFRAKDVRVYLEGMMKRYSQYGCTEGARHCAIIIDKNAHPINYLEDWQEKDWKKRFTKSQDITHVEVEGINYFVDWHKKDEWSNRYQMTIDLGWAWGFIISKNRRSLDDF